jgi:PleD family two-component response regulator
MGAPALNKPAELMRETDEPKRPPLVLIANDQEWSARSLATILEPSGYAVLRVYNGRQTLDMARSVQPDAVILDVRLPDLDGFEVCRQLYKERHIVAGTPVLLTTSDPINRPQQLNGLRVGAWDFMSQPLDGDLLLLKLHTYIKSKREADDLRQEALLDSATGLYSSRGLVRRAREIGAESLRRGGSLACLAFTPETPHEEVTIRLAEHLGGILGRTARVSDATGRLGQSEFAIVAPGTDSAGAVRLAERIRDAVASHPMQTTESEREVVTVRAGYCAVADFSVSSVDALEMLVRAASALRRGFGETGIQSYSDTPV